MDLDLNDRMVIERKIVSRPQSCGTQEPGIHTQLIHTSGWNMAAPPGGRPAMPCSAGSAAAIDDICSSLEQWSDIDMPPLCNSDGKIVEPDPQPTFNRFAAQQPPGAHANANVGMKAHVSGDGKTG